MISEIKLIQNVLVVDFPVMLPTGFILIPVDCDKWLWKHWFIQKQNLRLIWISHWIIRSTDSFKNTDSFRNEPYGCLWMSNWIIRSTDLFKNAKSFRNELVTESFAQLNHSQCRFIQERNLCDCLWMSHWIIRSTDFFKNADSFRNETCDGLWMSHWIIRSADSFKDTFIQEPNKLLSLRVSH